MPDSIDQAIAETETTPPIAMVQIGGRLFNGRPFSLTVPADLEVYEALDLCHRVPEVFAQLQQAQAARQGGIALPNGGLHVVKKAD